MLVALLALFVTAGRWQLGRAGEKHDLNAAFHAGSIVEELYRPVTDAEADEYRFRRFELTGRYDPEHQILLDSMVSAGRVGYQVITPFRVGAQTLLVNRGWVPADVDRRILPLIDVDSEQRTIVARLNRLPAPGIRLEGTELTEWPQRMLYPSRDQVVAALSIPVPDYQLLLEADQSDGYQRDWKAVEVGPQKHYGYAIQWFSFAALTLFFYVLLTARWTRQHRDLQQQAEDTND